MLQNLIGTVLEYVRGFLLVYVKANAEEFSCTDSLDQVVCLYQTSAGRIDQDHAVFHLFDALAVDHVVCAVHQRAVQGDQITLCQQFIKSYVRNKIF